MERVVDGTYPPGTRLVELALALAREFGVSQAPVREALRELAAIRLVYTALRKGTFVRAASQEDLAEVYLVRMALEETAGRCAVEALHADPSPLHAALEQHAGRCGRWRRAGAGATIVPAVKSRQ